MKHMVLSGLAMLLSSGLWAQGLPGSEILLFDINTDEAGLIGLGPGKNITQRPGYDSQPRFAQSGEVIYYTRFVDGQTDIYQYHLADGSTSVVMQTPESEYSPNVDHNSGQLSVVQVDAQGDQYLVLLDPKAKQAQRHSDLKQVGYFGWTHGTEAWAFVLNDQAGGDLYHTDAQQKSTRLSGNVGRSFITSLDRSEMYFVDKTTVPWRIKAQSKPQQAARDVMALPLGSEDFTLDSKGRLWAGRDNTLFISTDQQRWHIAAEFTDPDLHQISRVTTNPQADRIVLVFAEKTAPE